MCSLTMPYICSSQEMQNATAILPNYWQLYSSDLAKYLRQELCDLHMSKFLEDKKVLNWCPGFTKLYPLNATGLLNQRLQNQGRVSQNS